MLWNHCNSAALCYLFTNTLKTKNYNFPWISHVSCKLYTVLLLKLDTYLTDNHSAFILDRLAHQCEESRMWPFSTSVNFSNTKCFGCLQYDEYLLTCLRKCEIPMFPNAEQDFGIHFMLRFRDLIIQSRSRQVCLLQVLHLC